MDHPRYFAALAWVRQTVWEALIRRTPAAPEIFKASSMRELLYGNELTGHRWPKR